MGSAREAYRLEVHSEREGCRRCGHGQMWDIVAPNGVAISTSYADREVAEDFAHELTEAYRLGRIAGRLNALGKEPDSLRAALERVTGELAERIALDMDHRELDHSKWYRAVKRARKLLEPTR